jgi:hypothetical protein
MFYVNSLNSWVKERLNSLYDILEEVIVMDLSLARIAGLREAMHLMRTVRGGFEVIFQAIMV